MDQCFVSSGGKVMAPSKIGHVYALRCALCPLPLLYGLLLVLPVRIESSRSCVSLSSSVPFEEHSEVEE